MAQGNRTAIVAMAIIAVVIVVLFLSSNGMMGNWNGMGGGMMGRLGFNSDRGSSITTIGFWVLLGVGIAALFFWLKRSRGLR